MTDLKYDEIHPDAEGLRPDEWDPDVDEDVGDPGVFAALTGKLVEPPLPGYDPEVKATSAPEAAGPPNPSGLSDEHRVEARDLAISAALLVYHHRDEVHYSQNAVLRWGGIHNNLKAYQGDFAHYYDCSSYATWDIWNGLDHFSTPGHTIHDTVNDAHWQYGYTGTMLKHGVPGTEWVIRGDCVIYGNAWPGLHTAICIGGGMVLSHGSERGPLLLPINYRGDILARRRYI